MLPVVEHPVALNLLVPKIYVLDVEPCIVLVVSERYFRKAFCKEFVRLVRWGRFVVKRLFFCLRSLTANFHFFRARVIPKLMLRLVLLLDSLDYDCLLSDGRGRLRRRQCRFPIDLLLQPLNLLGKHLHLLHQHVDLLVFLLEFGVGLSYEQLLRLVLWLGVVVLWREVLMLLWVLILRRL